MRPYAFLVTAVVTAAAAAAPAAAFTLDERTVMQPERIAAELTGEGENMEIVANVEVPGASEIELAGDYAFMDSSAGLTVINIKDPRAPFVAGIGECGGSFGDVGVNGPATVAILAADGTAPACAEGTTAGVAIFDIADKTKPKYLSYVPAPRGAHTATIDGSLLIINNYDPQYRLIEIYDISDPAKPKKLSEVGVQPTAAHDTYVDRRPDGKVLLYSASISSYDIIDITDPASPLTVQKVRDNQNGLAHQLEPNFKRDVLIATDEYGGGVASGVCGKSPTADPTYMLGGIATAAQGTGFVHFYGAAADGTFNLNGADKLGTFNVPLHGPEPSGCTAHVFWQAPDQNRLTVAWYVQGSRVVDFSDPAQAKELGWFIPTGADTWSSKPHNGYVYASDLARGLDVLRYTGEGGAKWPATSGPAELQRFGATKVPSGPAAPPAQPNPGDARAIGTFKATSRLARVPGRKGKRTKLTFTVSDKDGVVLAKLRFNKKAGRKVAVRATGTAVAGTYRYVIRVGDRGKVLKRGRIKVKPKAGSTLSPDRTFVCRIR